MQLTENYAQETMKSIYAMKSIPEQIDSLRSLQDGWLNGEGVAPKGEGLDWVERKILEFLGKEGMPPIFIFPTPSGGIQIEWAGSQSVSLEVDIESKCGEFYSFKEGEEGYLVIPDLASDPGWKWIAKRVMEINNG